MKVFLNLVSIETTSLSPGGSRLRALILVRPPDTLLTARLWFIQVQVHGAGAGADAGAGTGACSRC